jgi:hypothetical protein
MCKDRARLAAEYERLCATSSASAKELLTAACALQRHKDTCRECQREKQEILAARREGIRG